jgi:sarcosine oxidase subunit gamma
MLKPLPHSGRWSLRLPAPLAFEPFQIEIPINRASQAGQRLAARLGPDEWLLVGPESEAPASPPGHHSLVDVSHRYAAFTVEGKDAPLVLAAGCPLDLHPSVFTAGSATRTLLGKAEIVLWRLGEAPSYRIECGRSFAPYVQRFLEEAVP